MVGRRRRGETTHLVPIGTAGPGEFFGCPFGSFKSSRLMVASALVNTFDSPKRVSTLRMVVSERRLMMYQLCIPCPVHCTDRRWFIRAVAVQKGMPYCFASPGSALASTVVREEEAYTRIDSVAGLREGIGGQTAKAARRSGDYDYLLHD